MKIRTALLAAAMLATNIQANDDLDITKMSFKQFLSLMMEIRDMSPEEQKMVKLRFRDLIPMTEEQCLEWMKSGSLFAGGGVLLNKIEATMECRVAIGALEILDSYVAKTESWTPSPRHDAFIRKFTINPDHNPAMGMDYSLFKDHCMVIYHDDAYCEGQTVRTGMGVANYMAHLADSFEIDPVLENTPISKKAMRGEISENSVYNAMISPEQTQKMIDEGANMPWASDPRENPPDPRWFQGNWR